MVGAWVIGLGAIAVAGIGGRLGAEGDRAEPDASQPRAAVTTPAPSPSRPIIALSEPAPPPATVTGIPLWVRGTTDTTVHEVLLVLRAGDAEVSRQSTRPSRTGTFAAVFTLKPPRPAMELTVFAIAQDVDAATLGDASRRVRLAPLDRVVAVPEPRPSLGEDGVLGSRGVDIAALRPAGAPPATSPGRVSWPRRGSLAAQVYR